MLRDEPPYTYSVSGSSLVQITSVREAGVVGVAVACADGAASVDVATTEAAIVGVATFGVEVRDWQLARNRLNRPTAIRIRGFEDRMQTLSIKIVRSACNPRFYHH